MSWQQAFGGLGQSFPYWVTPPVYNTQNAYPYGWAYPQMMAQYQITSHTCIHSDCPICKKAETEQVLKFQQELALVENKKKDYKKRCDEYMKEWRRKREGMGSRCIGL